MAASPHSPGAPLPLGGLVGKNAVLSITGLLAAPSSVSGEKTGLASHAWVGVSPDFSTVAVWNPSGEPVLHLKSTTSPLGTLTALVG